MVKSQIRKTYSEKRFMLTMDELQDLHAQILDRFSGQAWPPTQMLLSYSPVAHKREFNAAMCEDILGNHNTHMMVAWPRIADGGTAMEAIALTPQTRLVPNRYGIHEPEGNEVVEPILIDTVFVPLLAFDVLGYRVGYGKGFYDRFLMRCKSDVVRIGFSFFEPLPLIEDINEFDVPLNYCVTPTRVYEF